MSADKPAGRGYKATIERLRAELAEAQRLMLADAAEATRYGQRFREERSRRAAAESELAALRAASGQDRTQVVLDALIAGGFLWSADHDSVGAVLRGILGPAAPVGGQAEPSDEPRYTITEMIDHAKRWMSEDSPEFCGQVTAWLIGSRLGLRPAAAVSGEQA